MNVVIETSTRAAGKARPSSRQSLLNDVLAWALVALVALAPIPLGSNRPFFWGLNAAIVGFVGIVYFGRLGQIGEKPRRGIASIWPSAVVFAAVFAWLVVQVIPVGVLGPLAEVVRPYIAVWTAQGAELKLETISVAPDATLLMLARWATYGLFYFLVLQIGGNQQRRIFVLHAILAIVAFYGMFGLVSLTQFGDTLLGMAKWTYEGSATATFVNRNSFATFLAFGAVVSVALIFGSFVSRIEEDGALEVWRFDPLVVVYLVALAVIVAALLATQSRMGAFAAMTGCLVVAVLGSIRVPGLWVRTLLIVPLLLLVSVIGIYAFGQGLIERLGSIESSADVRIDLYRQIIEMIAARPWFGYGGGSFELAYPLYHQLPVSPDLLWDRAHNSYLALIVELGIPAGGAILLALALAFLRAGSRIARARSEWAARAATLGALVVGGTHSLVDFSLEMQANALIFLMLVGLGALSGKHVRNAS